MTECLSNRKTKLYVLTTRLMRGEKSFVYSFKTVPLLQITKIIGINKKNIIRVNWRFSDWLFKIVTNY